MSICRKHDFEHIHCLVSSGSGYHKSFWSLRVCIYSYQEHCTLKQSDEICEPVAMAWLAIFKGEVVQLEVCSLQLGNPQNLLQVTQYPYPDLATRNNFMTLSSFSQLDDS